MMDEFDDLDALDDFLLDRTGDEAMLAGELDGYLTALSVCTQAIPEQVWMPYIWSWDGDPGLEPEFESPAERDTIFRLIAQHRRGIEAALESGAPFIPLFEIDDSSEDVIWEIWLQGFYRAMRLAPEYWVALAEGGRKEVRQAVGSLLNLQAIADRDSDLPKNVQKTANDLAPALIPGLVSILYAAARDREYAPVEAEKAADPQLPLFGKVGRNDPCPCGSGKKYKKCHGA